MVSMLSTPARIVRLDFHPIVPNTKEGEGNNRDLKACQAIPPPILEEAVVGLLRRHSLELLPLTPREHLRPPGLSGYPPTTGFIVGTHRSGGEAVEATCPPRLPSALHRPHVAAIQGQHVLRRLHRHYVTKPNRKHKSEMSPHAYVSDQ
jgi:hypothetical protein